MASSRLKHFMLDEIADMTMEDEMDLASLGEKKRAIFVCTPVNDTSFNYLVSMMYMQAFQQLYDRAEREYGGRLPRHVRFIMDEFLQYTATGSFRQCVVYLPLLQSVLCSYSAGHRTAQDYVRKGMGIADGAV